MFTPGILLTMAMLLPRCRFLYSFDINLLRILKACVFYQNVNYVIVLAFLYTVQLFTVCSLSLCLWKVLFSKYADRFLLSNLFSIGGDIYHCLRIRPRKTFWHTKLCRTTVYDNICKGNLFAFGGITFCGFKNWIELVHIWQQCSLYSLIWSFIFKYLKSDIEFWEGRHS